MSWAAHDPEGWTEVCLTGILARLDRSRGLTQPERDVDRRVLEDLADNGDAYNVFLALCEWAGNNIAEAEADWLSSEF